MTKVLEIKSAAKAFRDDWMKLVETLHDVSLSIDQGKCIGLLGHNGAGKTTTIRIILGLIAPTSGEVLFCGKKMTRSDRGQIGYMPEVNKLPSELRCQEILHQHLLMYDRSIGFKKAKIQATKHLREVGLLENAQKKVRQLSKGMARRLGWALATIHNPKLLILDEPFSGLDPYARESLESGVSAARQTGKSILLCTHELDAARRLCDEVVVLHSGRVAFDSSLEPQTKWDQRSLMNYIYPADKKVAHTLHAAKDSDNADDHENETHNLSA